MLKIVNDVYSDAILTSEEFLAGQLRAAIQTSRAVEFLYDGKRRLVEVHAIGRSTKDGSLLARGYQVGGQSSRQLPQWTLFTVNKMQGLQLTEQESYAPRPGYATADRQLSPVISELAQA